MTNIESLLARISTYIDATDDRYRIIPSPEISRVTEGDRSAGNYGAALINGVWYPIAQLRQDKDGNIYVDRRFLKRKTCGTIGRVIEYGHPKYTEILNPDIQALYPYSVVISGTKYPMSALVLDMDDNIYVSNTFKR